MGVWPGPRGQLGGSLGLSPRDREELLICCSSTESSREMTEKRSCVGGDGKETGCVSKARCRMGCEPGETSSDICRAKWALETTAPTYEGVTVVPGGHPTGLQFEMTLGWLWNNSTKVANSAAPALFAVCLLFHC